MNFRGPSARLLIVVSITVLLSVPSYGQYGAYGLTDARQLALGNTYASNSRELYASGKNPALIANRRYDSRKFSILFPNLSTRTYNISKTTKFINDFFSQKPLDIISSIDGSIITRAFNNNGRLALGLQIGYIAAAYTPSEKIGSFSFVIKEYLTGFLQLPKIMNQETFDLFGTEKAFGLRDFRFSAWWMRTYELAYSREIHVDQLKGIRSVFVGATVKYYNGFIYNDITFSAGAGVSTSDKRFIGGFEATSNKAYSNDINPKNLFSSEGVIESVPFMHPVGKGFGMDLGLGLLIEPGVMVGVSLTDLGTITWKGKTKKSIVAGRIEIDSSLTIDDIDSIFSSIVIRDEKTGSFKTKPSPALHVGFSFQIDRFAQNLPGEMNLAVEIHQGIDKGPVNLGYPRAAFGLDWKPGKKWPVFLSGITYLGTDKMAWSGGLGYEFRFVELYLASADILSFINNMDQQSLSLSACWHFWK